MPKALNRSVDTMTDESGSENYSGMHNLLIPGSNPGGQTIFS